MSVSAPPVTELWYTRCPVPTASSLAIAQGWLDEEFAPDGIAVASLRSSADRAVRESHFGHTQANSFRQGGNIPPLWARSHGADVRLIGLSWAEQYQAVVTRRDSGIEGPADLAGRKLALPRRLNDQIDFWQATALRGYESTLAPGGPLARRRRARRPPGGRAVPAAGRHGPQPLAVRRVHEPPPAVGRGRRADPRRRRRDLRRRRPRPGPRGAPRRPRRVRPRGAGRPRDQDQQHHAGGAHRERRAARRAARPRDPLRRREPARGGLGEGPRGRDAPDHRPRGRHRRGLRRVRLPRRDPREPGAEPGRGARGRDRGPAGLPGAPRFIETAFDVREWIDPAPLAAARDLAAA